MKVNVGTVRSDHTGFNSIAYIAEQTRGVLFDSVELDFSYCGFFEANMAAPLYAVVSRIRDELNDVSLTNLTPSLETILRKNHFLTKFQKTSLIDTNHTTVPFKIFKLQAGEQFFEYLESYMDGKGIPTMSEILTKRFRQSLFEIFQNAAIHSKSSSGVFTCGQFFPQKHRLDFTIADAGVGIRDNVRQYTGNTKMNSCMAIGWALTEGNTTKTGDQPGGLGLKLLKDFIWMNKGKLQIVSRYGYYEFSATGENCLKLDHDFPGTCVNIEINTQDTSSYYLKSELSSDDIF
ncbi:ATP-binding protein [Nitrosococcus watsonii]|uniref:ATP-binding region, ATPase-like protein n=1 Tax=Nitrosococcus watsoni (strain C-113) TaxID=105559 RepID=D8K844_NITWC|nr:ATP-binding protein [Nitrosococcus watsonii]ADJ27039.1 ATP-binding region, ATPase-like protein [Nitrosococcus watsonii C-113]